MAKVLTDETLRAEIDGRMTVDGEYARTFDDAFFRTQGAKRVESMIIESLVAHRDDVTEIELPGVAMSVFRVLGSTGITCLTVRCLKLEDTYNFLRAIESSNVTILKFFIGKGGLDQFDAINSWRGFDKIRELEFSTGRFDGAYLHSHGNLVKLTFNYSDLHDVRPLLGSLVGSKVMELSLTRNSNLTTDSIEAIGKFIAHAKEGFRMDISACGVADARPIVRAMAQKSCGLGFLDLRRNNINLESREMVMTHFRTNRNPNLQCLKLAGNGFDTDFMAEVDHFNAYQTERRRMRQVGPYLGEKTSSGDGYVENMVLSFLVGRKPGR